MANATMQSGATELHRRFLEAIHARDIEALVALYEADAILVPSPGQPVRGTELIRAAFGGLLAGSPVMTLDTVSELSTGEIALMQSRWTMKLAGPGGSPLEMAGVAAEVARRQPDGRWLYALDNPFAGQ